MPGVLDQKIKNFYWGRGGSGRIRTSDTLSGITDFESVPFDHSGTLPYNLVLYGFLKIIQPCAAILS